jgi:hypothetical protein
MQAQLAPRKLVQEMEVQRALGFDLTLSEHLKNNYNGTTVEELYKDLEINPQRDTIKLILDKPDESIRWLVPEIIRDAIRRGFINSPIHKDFIIREEPVAQLAQVMPFWDMTGVPNEPKDLGPAETMELGTIVYGQKNVRIGKTGIGLQIDDEAIQYVSVSLMSIFLADVGIKLGSALSVKAVACLINGDQADGSEGAGTVGVASANAMIYNDLIKVFVRGSLRNRNWLRCIGDEDTVNFMLDMPEFRRTNMFGQPMLGLNTHTPVPKEIDVYTHSSVPENQLVMVDPTLAMVQLTAQPLKVESERIVSRQINGTYVSLTTGFAIIQRDARIVLDRSVTTAWPTWLAPLY